MCKLNVRHINNFTAMGRVEYTVNASRMHLYTLALLSLQTHKLPMNKVSPWTPTRNGPMHYILILQKLFKCEYNVM